MSIAVSNRQVIEQFSGNAIMLTATVTLDTSYPTGGSAGLAAALGLKQIYGLSVVQHAGYLVDYVAGDKLQVFNTGGTGAGTKATEVTNATNLSATTVTALVVGQLG
jgi:hypothetical protein